jgi:hypothetical protein
METPGSTPRYVTDAIVCSSATAAESLLFVFADVQAPSIRVLVAHGFIVVILQYIVLRLSSKRHDTGVLLLALLAIGSTGPIGGAGCSILAWCRLFTRHWTSESHRQWYPSHEIAAQGIAHPSEWRVPCIRGCNPEMPIPMPVRITCERLAERAAVFHDLSARFEGALAGVLQSALTSSSPGVRAPAYAILERLLVSGAVAAERLESCPIRAQSEADQAVIEAARLLQRMPFALVSSPLCGNVAAAVCGLCRRILGEHPRHWGAFNLLIRAEAKLKQTRP